MAGSEIGEDHFGIRLAIDGKTVVILTATGQNQAAVCQRLALSRGLTRFLGTNSILQNRLTRLLEGVLTSTGIGDRMRGKEIAEEAPLEDREGLLLVVGGLQGGHERLLCPQRDHDMFAEIIEVSPLGSVHLGSVH